MLLATMFDYKRLKSIPDIESTSLDAANNNEKGVYIDKNFTEDRRISMIQDNGKELIDKIRRESIQHAIGVKRQRSRGNCFFFLTK